MKKILLLIALILFIPACGRETPKTDKSPETGSISGTVRVNKPPGSRIYLAIGENLDEMARGNYVRHLVLNDQGPFRFDDVPAGAYRMAAFVDIIADARPNFLIEPYFVFETELSVSPGKTIEGISVEDFFNERDPAFKTAERIKQYKALNARAKAAVDKAYEKLKAGKNNLLIEVMPTLRAMVYEAETAWKPAGNESDWEHVTALLEPVPKIAQGAIEGRNLISSLRGFYLRAYLSDLDRSVQRYAVYVPKEYDGSRPFPLVVALHGAGGDHWSGMKTVTGFSGQLIGPEASNRHFFPQSAPPDFIIASPGGHGYIGPGYEGPGEYDVQKVIAEMKSSYNIDADRIYLTGVSKGGRGAWEIGLTYPEMFAAIAPVAGGTGGVRNLAKNAARVRIFAFHGAADKIISVNESRAMAAAVYQEGIPVEFEYAEYADWSHYDCVRVYENGAIFNLFRQ